MEAAVEHREALLGGHLALAQRPLGGHQVPANTTAIMMNQSNMPTDTHVWLNFQASLDMPTRPKPKSPASTTAAPCT